MAIGSSLKSRRLSKRAEATQQILVFRLRQEWFALPIQAVLKVVPLGHVYGDPQGTGVSLTLYEDKELLVVDVAHRIFGETLTPALASKQPLSDPAAAAKPLAYRSNLGEHLKSTTSQRYLLILESAQERVGLPIDSKPSMRRVPASIFTPLPAAYICVANIRCVSSLMMQAAEEPPIFLLNPEQLAQPQQIAPAAAAPTPAAARATQHAANA